MHFCILAVCPHRCRYRLGADELYTEGLVPEKLGIDLVYIREHVDLEDSRCVMRAAKSEIRQKSKLCQTQLPKSLGLLHRLIHLRPSPGEVQSCGHGTGSSGAFGFPIPAWLRRTLTSKSRGP